MANKVTRSQLKEWGFGALVDGAPKNPRTKAVDADGMNRTERAYANHLATLKLCGEIRDWKFEPFKFRLAGRTFLTIDFVVWHLDGSVECHDIKGHLEDDAAVKIKTVAEQQPWFRFWLVYREGGRWTYHPVTRQGIGKQTEWSCAREDSCGND
ncbi:hypothetical protein [Singulisphaera sp. PoT]|uniref:hypothetical protein n=1 Tax=Singulisphaera sp. PoT TaxID=3411797 RepID=UPI003BF4880F